MSISPTRWFIIVWFVAPLIWSLIAITTERFHSFSYEMSQLCEKNPVVAFISIIFCHCVLNWKVIPK